MNLRPLTFRGLAWRGARFHWRAHLGVVLGAAIGSATLTGALVVGDSVRTSLGDHALARVGKAELVLAPTDRFFTDKTATNLLWNKTVWEAGGVKGTFAAQPAAALQLKAIAARPDASARANDVTVIGVTSPGPETRREHELDEFDRSTGSFWDYAPDGLLRRISPGGVRLNEGLARRLNVKAGDTVLVRLAKPSALSRESPVSPRSDSSTVLRLRCEGIVSESGYGNFGLAAGQSPGLNAFVNLDELQAATGLPGRVNLLLVPPAVAAQPPGTSRLLSSVRPNEKLDRRRRLPVADALALADVAFQQGWSLADTEQSLVLQDSNRVVELRSRRVFLDDAVVRAAVVAAPGTIRRQQEDRMGTTWKSSLPGEGGAAKDMGTTWKPSLPGVELLTYLANLLLDGTNATPYSMVTAAGPPYTPLDLGDDEIVLNDWLARDLQGKPGDVISLVYFAPDSGAQLVERTNQFRVRSVVPMQMPWADRTLMPDFPGIEKAESTSDWDTAFPLVYPIRPRDEAYWKEYRGTPKAFVTLAAGQKLWGNRFGNLTALRFALRATPAQNPAGTRPLSPEDCVEALSLTILTHVQPAQLGFTFQPVREQALAAASQGQDFGQLFLGFSMFLVVAALLLMALMFQFGLEQRAAETGTLLALGFTPRQVRRLLLLEVVFLASAGGIVGALGGLGFAQAMLWGLSTLWRDAVAGSVLRFHVSPSTLVLGFFASTALAVLTIGLSLRRQARRPARELLARESSQARFAAIPVFGEKGSCKLGFLTVAALAAAIGAIGMVGWALANTGGANAETFFSAGSLLLAAGFLGAWSRLRGWSVPVPSDRPDADRLALRNCGRRPTRSLTTIALLAGATFVIASLALFRLDATRGGARRDSGTGGFALIGQSTLPILHDLNTATGREAYGLNPKDLAAVNLVPFRVRDGDEASCLNLNRAQQPRLLGVNPELLHGRFTFTQAAKGLDPQRGWDLLRDRSIPEVVPAIGDANSIRWALGKHLGDTIDYIDERGRVFKIRLVGAVANSILQGSLVIDDTEFARRFPSQAGWRFFLADAPADSVAHVSAALTRALQDIGLEVAPAATRLEAFNAVQNTYLGTFQVLGGLGLLLGSAGLGIVVLRNVLERRSELAVLSAVGFRPGALQRLVLLEHLVLLGFGLGIGLVAAAIAVLPALFSLKSQLPYLSLALTLAAVLLNGLFCTWLAARFALRGNLLAALRNE